MNDYERVERKKKNIYTEKNENEHFDVFMCVCGKGVGKREKYLQPLAIKTCTENHAINM